MRPIRPGNTGRASEGPIPEDVTMASRPLAFGVRLRDKGRTVTLRAHRSDPGCYVVEDSGRGREKRRRDHPSLGGALRDLASTWRGRLH